MADTKEIGATPEVANIEPITTDTLNLPQGWMYRQRKIGSLVLPWYASPRVQLLMVSMVCFLCPGMFNALGGLGGGGKADATLADNMVRTSRIAPIDICTMYHSDLKFRSQISAEAVLKSSSERSPL
jgi:hypothetical protein